MKRNEANWDRVVRVVLGVALLALGLLVLDGAAGVAVAVLALVPLVTGAVGTCPLYSLLGVSTCEVRTKSHA